MQTFSSESVSPIMGTTSSGSSRFSVPRDMEVDGLCLEQAEREIVAQDMGEAIDIHGLQREGLLARFQLLKVEQLIHQVAGVRRAFLVATTMSSFAWSVSTAFSRGPKIKASGVRSSYYSGRMQSFAYRGL